MADEIDLLRGFRDETPGPSAGAWARARAAVAAARLEEGQPGPRRRRRRPGLPRRAWIAAAAAVVLVAAGGAAAGLAVSGGSAGPPDRGHTAAGAGLMTVEGCPDLDAVSGTLVQADGASLVLKIPGGHRMTVTTRASSTISRQVPGSLGDVTNGAYVIVFGTTAGGQLAAKDVNIGANPLPVPAGGDGQPRSRSGHRHGIPRGLAIGTVSGVRAGGFTVVMGDSIDVPVTTSGSTAVLRLTGASVSQLRVGELTDAFGSAGPHGTLVASTVEQGSQLPHLDRGGTIARLHSQGCSPAAITTAALFTGGWRGR